MGLPTGRDKARSGRVCMFVCANVHAPFLSKAPRVIREFGHVTRRSLRRSLDGTSRHVAEIPSRYRNSRPSPTVFSGYAVGSPIRADCTSAVNSDHVSRLLGSEGGWRGQNTYLYSTHPILLVLLDPHFLKYFLVRSHHPLARQETHQYLVLAPRAATTTRTRRGMLSTRALKKAPGMAAHSFCSGANR